MKKITMMIPLNFNSGDEIPQEQVDFITEKILNIAGGYTSRKVEGFWQNEEGKIFKDNNLEITTSTTSDNIKALKSVASQACLMLNQEVIYFEIQDIEELNFVASEEAQAI